MGLEEAILLCARDAEGGAKYGALPFKSVMGQFAIRTSIVLSANVRALNVHP